MKNKVIIIMGVSGSGKTTIGELLSAETGWPFYDADSFHPKENIDKMKAGIPLTDDDRWPWLDAMNHFAKEKIKTTPVILSCSALKEIYRQRLTKGIEENCSWIFLEGSYELILKRMQQRRHYMPPALLQSQFDILEVPNNALVIDVSDTESSIVQQITALYKI